MEAKMAKVQAYRGLCAAPFTPFDERGQINLNLIEEYVDLLRKQSVTGAFVNGSTGEGVSLTVAERKKLTERWVQQSKGKLDLLIAHVTASSILDTQELATHAESLNVDAISVLPPFYFRCPTNDHLARYIEEVSKAAPNTPIIYYHIPDFTRVNARQSSSPQELGLNNDYGSAGFASSSAPPAGRLTASHANGGLVSDHSISDHSDHSISDKH